jgi:hypothetical protein
MRVVRQFPATVAAVLVLAGAGCFKAPDSGPRADDAAPGARNPAPPTADPPGQPNAAKAKEVSFPTQKVAFDLPPGWKCATNEVKGDRVRCVLKKEGKGTAKATVAIWTGDEYAAEAVAKGAQILFDGEKPAKDSPQALAAGGAWACREALSLALGGNYQPGQTSVAFQDVGLGGVMQTVQTEAEGLVGVGVFSDPPASDGGPLLVGWAFDEDGKEDATQLVKRIFEGRK